LSPLIDGKIQAFPRDHWRDEFAEAERIGFKIMEWTIDVYGFHENPLLNEQGRSEIKCLMEKHRLRIPSLTGDCFMQEPFYKKSGKDAKRLMNDFVDLIHACERMGIGQILIPLVDSGRIENRCHKERLLKGLQEIEPLLHETSVSVTFESDMSPDALVRFIDLFDPQYFGITYDIGNSASLGYRAEDEIRAYGHRILNVHVKDRVYKGGSVPLGSGNADIPLALRMIRDTGYTGNYILQTARAENDDHAGLLFRYKAMVESWLKEKGQ